jgi:hypothetical protein
MAKFQIDLPFCLRYNKFKLEDPGKLTNTTKNLFGATECKL